MSVKTIIFIIVLVLFLGYFFMMRKPKYNKGIDAPGFKGIDLQGNRFELRDLRGKYVYLDFWGSWCGPCRAIRPQLVDIYNKYHDKKFKNASGFEIISVAMERKPGQWDTVRRSEGMLWPYQFSTLEKEGREVAGLYGVKSIPSGYFLGPDGSILLNRPQMDEMAQYLRKNLSN